MAGRVPEHVIQQIVRSVDFVRLVGRHCELRKKGKTFWGLCPFHKEKTPSFSVDPENGLYYCFGCKEGGNVFTLLEKLEGLSFGESLRMLAREAGVDLSAYEEGPAAPRGESARLREVNELATSFYEKCLRKARGAEQAREYLRGRGFTDESVAAWRLGYAPEGWENFLKCAAGRGYEPELVEKAGLALARQGAEGHYDRFRNRLMFPIADATGRTIAFGARALSPEDEPKYLNSPETPLFSKGNCFFGLNRAREAIRTAKTAAILEGYTDVIMAHQGGVAEAVAVLGTALTQDHARTLRRLCERVVLVFDADEAGRKSAARSIEVLLNEELEIRVASLPAGQDPCDYVLERGGEEFRRRLEESLGFFQFRLALARAQEGEESLDGQMRIFAEVAELALLVRDAARRDMIVRWLAHELGMREGNAWAWVERRLRRRPAPREEGEPAEQEVRRTAGDKFASELLGLLLAHPELTPRAAEGLRLDVLPEGPEKRVLARILADADAGEGLDAQALLGSLGEADLAAAASGALAEEQTRQAHISQKEPEERLESYLDYAERRQTLAAGQRRPENDDELRAYVRKLKAEDKKSARLR